MPANEGVLGTFSFKGEHAHTMDHPPVLRQGAVKASSGIYPAGLVLMRDAQDKLVPWDGSATPVGVCDVPCDTATSASCIYLAHGSVRAAALTKTGGATLTPADHLSLEKATIYAL